MEILSSRPAANAMPGWNRAGGVQKTRTIAPMRMASTIASSVICPTAAVSAFSVTHASADTSKTTPRPGSRREIAESIANDTMRNADSGITFSPGNRCARFESPQMLAPPPRLVRPCGRPLTAQETSTEREAAADVITKMNALEQSLDVPAWVTQPYRTERGARSGRRARKGAHGQGSAALGDDITRHPEIGFVEYRVGQETHRLPQGARLRRGDGRRRPEDGVRRPLQEE